MLHITNGDVVAEILQASGIAREALPWRDILHEGPVPSGLALQELSAVRSSFLAAQHGEVEKIRRSFDKRDGALASWREHDEIVLWFEHDLYDQLQLIQILDVFADGRPEPGRLQLLCIDRHPEVERFRGLGQLTAEQLTRLLEQRREVTEEHLQLARSTWRAFRSPDPTAITPWLGAASFALPFLAPALRRHLEQFPSTVNGLGRTEQQILEGIDSGRHRALELFRYDQLREESPFLGDSVFQAYLERLASGERPMLRMTASEDMAEAARSSEWSLTPMIIELTDDGRRVLAGDADRLRLGGVDFWLGGVHLQGREVWRWDAARRRVTASGSSI